MRIRGILVLLCSAGLLAGCGPLPKDETPGEAATRELREVRAKVSGSYQVDFSATWNDYQDGIWTWSGTLSSTGKDWQAVGDLKLKDKDAVGDLKLTDQQFAHIESVQSGTIRYHKQSGTIGYQQWQSVQGDSVGNYYWKMPRPREPADTPKIHDLPEVDALLYLDLEYATQVTRGNLPDGGHRYEFDQSVWLADPLQQRIKKTVTPPSKLVVDVDGAGLPSRVEFASNSNGHLTRLQVTMTVRAAGAAVSVGPPPSGEVVPALR